MHVTGSADMQRGAAAAPPGSNAFATVCATVPVSMCLRARAAVEACRDAGRRWFGDRWYVGCLIFWWDLKWLETIVNDTFLEARFGIYVS